MFAYLGKEVIDLYKDVCLHLFSLETQIVLYLSVYYRFSLHPISYTYSRFYAGIIIIIICIISSVRFEKCREKNKLSKVTIVIDVIQYSTHRHGLVIYMF